MSCDGFTVKTPDGREICVPLYREVDIWKKPDPIKKEGPIPEPWDEIFADIRTLATINDGIRHLKDERIRKAMFETVQGLTRSLELPEGVKLGDGLFKGEKAFLAAK